MTERSSRAEIKNTAESKVFFILTLVGLGGFLVFFSSTNAFLMAQFAGFLDALRPGDVLPPIMAVFCKQQLWTVGLVAAAVLLIVKEKVVRESRIRFWINCSSFALFVALITAYALALAGPVVLLSGPMRAAIGS